MLLFYYAYSQVSAPPSRIIGTVGSKGGSSWICPNYTREHYAPNGFRTMRSDLYRVFLARLHARRFIKVRKKRGGNCLLCLYASYAFEDVTKVHHLECNQYSLLCPNRCRENTFERWELKNHLDQCPLALIDCPFHHTGCDARILLKDLAEHTEKEAVVHLALLARVTENLTRENRELRETERRQENLSLEISVELREQESRRNAATIRGQERERERKQQELEYVQQSTDTHLNSMRAEMKKLRLELIQHTQSSGFPIDYRIALSGGDIFLPPFFTHPHGYRLCLQVFPNSYRRGKGTHVSLFMYVMQGPFDSLLKWQFRGELTVQVVNQVGDHDHWEAGGMHAVRVIGRERAEGGWGFHHFIPHTILEHGSAKEVQFVKENHFIVRVVDVNCMA